MDQDPTGSSLERGAACPGSFAIEGLDHAGPYTESGLVLDRFIEHARVDREAALAEAPEEERDFFAKIPIEQIPEGLESQVPVGYRIEDGAVKAYSTAEVPSHRAYPRDGFIHATLDFAGVGEFNRPIHYDLKRYDPKVEPAESLQLGFGAVVIAKIIGATSADLGFLRVGWDGRPWFDKAFFDEEALTAMEARIVATVRRTRYEQKKVKTGQPLTLATGPQCTYCPARFRDCPLVANVTEALVQLRPVALGRQTLTEWFAERSVEEAGSLVSNAILIEKIAKAVREVANARVKTTGEDLPLGGGEVLAEVLHGQEVIDPEAKVEIDALKFDLRRRKLIRTEKVLQVRAVARGGR